MALVSFSPSGGLFQFAAQLGDALAAHGHDVHLITGPRPELAARHPRFTIHPVLPTWHPMDTAMRGATLRKLRRAVRGLRLGVAWLLLLARLRRMRPDVVLWSNWPFSMDALGVLLARRLLPRPMLGMIAHEPRLVSEADTTSYKNGPVLDRALPAAWRRMDVVFVLGEDARTRLLENWQPRGPVIVIPHGDENALRDGQPVLPVAKTGPVALFFGTWTAYKGIDVLLDSVPEVRRRVPDARVVLAGGVAEVDLPALLRRAEQVGGVRARPGYVPREEIPELFAEARVVVTPYRRASQSGVAHLAYTFERPVVATTVGDIPQVVRDGETGLLVPPGDPSALAEALVSLLTDPERAKRLGEAGGRWLAAEASWERVAQRVDAGLEQAARHRSSSQ
ncbi:MAG: glycosyltransferase family 4 protein [Actinomycetota bacterium]|nr:glycosyltransferase family 4 protein [Actinomycetota bacterium]